MLSFYNAMNIDVMNLGNTIKNENQASQQDRAKAMNENQASQQDRAKAIIFLLHHLHDELNKNEYLIVKVPLTLWNNLRERYKYQNTVILPKSSLSLDAHEVALFKISSQLKVCGEKVTYDDIYHISCLECAPAAAISRA
jgi:ubiquitin C-terminal hydrolase